MRHTTVVAIAAALLVATGCGENPTAPPEPRLPPVNLTPSAPALVVDGPFEITGLVTDEQGAPVAGAEVSMGHYTSNGLRRPVVRTDDAGRYAITFSIDPSMSPGKFSARAEVVAEGHDQFRRSIYDPVRHRVENFRLRRIRRIAAGETMLVEMSTDNGDCFGWLYGPCGRLRVTASSAGDLTIEAVPTVTWAGRLQIEACCFGDELWGNPMTVHVDAGFETSIEIGQWDFTATAAPTVLVKTSFKPD